VLQKLRTLLLAIGHRLALVLSRYDRDGYGLFLAERSANALRMLAFAPTERDVPLILEICGNPKTDSFVHLREIASAIDTNADTGTGRPPKLTITMHEVISNSGRTLPFVHLAHSASTAWSHRASRRSAEGYTDR
jgi:hypothetical protein